MKRLDFLTTAEFSFCKRLALARLKAGEWGSGIQGFPGSVRGFSLCLTFRLSTGPAESPTRTTQKLYDLVTLLYSRMYLQKDSWRKFCLRICVQSRYMFVYIHIYIHFFFCFSFLEHMISLFCHFTLQQLFCIWFSGIHSLVGDSFSHPFSPCWF